MTSETTSSANLGVSPIEEIIADARLGRPYILVDAADRENEGDVIIPAQFATPERINFMAVHARGLICLALTADRARTLGLRPMTPENHSQHETAFTASIEAREGVTTGISAFDRAHTIAVAVNQEAGASDLVSPGHVFPLVARDGGVLVRAGHTEAAVDVSRLAGLNPSGVICEIMNDDGSMARLPDLVVFAQTHGLKIGAIEDLISYRRRTEKQVEAVVDGAFESTYGGRFRLLIYRNLLDQTEHVVLMKGRVDPSRPTLVRMHRVDVFSDLMGLAAGREDYVEQALRSIAAHDGPGIVVLIRDPRPDSLTARVADYRQAVDPTPGIVRDYGVGAQILADLGVEDMILMSNSKSILPASAGYGLKVIDQVPLVARGVGSPGGQSGTSDSGGAGARVRLVNGGR